MENGNKNGITKNSKISIGLGITILGAVLLAYGSFITIQAQQENIEKDVDFIRQDYVPRNEIEVQLNSINQKLDRLIEN